MTRKFPNFLSFLVEVIPPSQPHQQSTSHIFHSPKVKRTQNHNYNESVNISEKITKNEVTNWRQTYTIKAAALKAKVKIQAMGWEELDRLISLYPFYFSFCYYWSSFKGSLVSYFINVHYSLRL